MKRKTAMKRVELAIKRGLLIRPDICEVCEGQRVSKKRPAIVAHHWNGYNNPLDIWWLCRSCNRFLDVHDGSLTIEQAREYIKKKQLVLLFHYRYQF